MDAQIKLLIQEVKLHCYSRIKEELETARKSPYDDDYVDVIEYPYNVMENSQLAESVPVESPTKERDVAGGSPLTDFEEPAPKQITIDEAIDSAMQKQSDVATEKVEIVSEQCTAKEQYKYERRLANLRINKITQRAHDRVCGYQSVIKYLDELLEKYEAESTSYDV